VAHSARLVLGRLVVSRPRRTLSREGMTLQAKQVNLTNAQVTWIRRAMRSVTTVATLRFDRYMFINKRACLFSVAFDTNGIAARHGTHLAQGGGAVSIVAIAASDQPFVDPVVIRLRKIRFS